MTQHPSRREAMAACAAGGALLAMHGPLAARARAQGSAPLPSGMPDNPRILALGLRTAASLDVMASFYGGKLGLEVERVREDALLVQAGRTAITFTSAKPGEGEPYYHFAFNIPENKVREAHDWQQERSALIETPAHMLDSAYPKGVRHFRNWNAHSVFFFDPAMNVVEYIGRHDLANARDGGFSSDDILYASEIAFTSDDVAATADVLRERLGVAPYKGQPEGFRAMGDEHGLLLVFNTGRIMIPDVESRKFPTFARVRGPANDRFTLAVAEHEIEAVPG